ncbi:hypothetical protein E2562_004419 [Oryza meyeriana var. granulata]|uniref:Uncharacterized protein n=1 Tax=Oryza meyeriana var. granulata TaxID=110450 RepID=A0A6G1CZC0_9ORYZ|nr:hypothetical protein E2562_004419 [Oryza meyeriana var. granulata]
MGHGPTHVANAESTVLEVTAAFFHWLRRPPPLLSTCSGGHRRLSSPALEGVATSLPPSSTGSRDHHRLPHCRLCLPAIEGTAATASSAGSWSTLPPPPFSTSSRRPPLPSLAG